MEKIFLIFHISFLDLSKFSSQVHTKIYTKTIKRAYKALHSWAAPYHILANIINPRSFCYELLSTCWVVA